MRVFVAKEEEACCLWLETSVNVSEKIHFREWFFNSLGKGAKPKKPRESNSKLATKNSVESTLQTNEYDGGEIFPCTVEPGFSKHLYKELPEFQKLIF